MGGSVVRLLEITLVTSLKVGGSNPVWENASTRFQQQNMMAIPGTGFVGMMQEMGRAAAQRVLPVATLPDIEKLTRLCAKYQIDIVGPLPD